MRAVVQRVREVSVEVDGKVISEIGEGLLALVGVGRQDDLQSAEELARKLVHLRVFEDERARMNASLLDSGGSLAVVSQFTLFGDMRKGRRPSFDAAASPEHAEPLVEHLVETARSLGVTTVTGRFRATMDVSLVNCGPVTVLIDTDKQF